LEPANSEPPVLPPPKTLPYGWVWVVNYKPNDGAAWAPAPNKDPPALGVVAYPPNREPPALAFPAPNSYPPAGY
jgi:hypothetical protein